MKSATISPFSDGPAKRSAEFATDLHQSITAGLAEAAESAQERDIQQRLDRQRQEDWERAAADRRRVIAETFRYRLDFAAGEASHQHHSVDQVSAIKREANTRMVIAAVKAELGDYAMEPKDAAKRIITHLTEKTGLPRQNVVALTVDEAIEQLTATPDPADSAAVGGDKPKRRNNVWIETARALLTQNPNMSDAKIAIAVRKDRSVLSRSKKWKAIREEFECGEHRRVGMEQVHDADLHFRRKTQQS
ncbi:hypothetical protein [Rubripirellula lacrimiformis]|nr:hypothetical protein [Rubripirellula lacrimiformis]